MSPGKGESIGDDSAFLDMVAEFLAAHAFKQVHGGYPAFDGKLVQEVEAVRAQEKLLVFVTPVICEWPEKSAVKPAFSLWFLVCNEADEQKSFAVETELVIAALENAAGSFRGLLPIPAVEAHDPGGHRVLAGDPLCLTIEPVRVEPGSGATEPRLPACGIRFEIGKSENPASPPLYSFAMVGITPFLALSAALSEGRGSIPSRLGDELGKLRKATENA